MSSQTEQTTTPQTDTNAAARTDVTSTPNGGGDRLRQGLRTSGYDAGSQLVKPNGNGVPDAPAKKPDTVNAGGVEVPKGAALIEGPAGRSSPGPREWSVFA